MADVEALQLGYRGVCGASRRPVALPARDRLGRLSGISVLHSSSVLYGGFKLEMIQYSLM
jgi:hypothetical protein